MSFFVLLFSLRVSPLDFNQQLLFQHSEFAQLLKDEVCPLIIRLFAPNHKHVQVQTTFSVLLHCAKFYLFIWICIPVNVFSSMTFWLAQIAGFAVGVTASTFLLVQDVTGICLCWAVTQLSGATVFSNFHEAFASRRCAYYLFLSTTGKFLIVFFYATVWTIKFFWSSFFKFSLIIFSFSTILLTVVLILNEKSSLVCRFCKLDIDSDEKSSFYYVGKKASALFALLSYASLFLIIFEGSQQELCIVLKPMK